MINNPMPKAFILEDEPHNLYYLQDLLRDFNDKIQVQGQAQTLAQARILIHDNPPDLLFLDIHLPDGHGFDLLPDLPPHCRVIFTTAYADYALQAFKHEALHYLLKPIDPQELEQALQRFFLRYEEQNLNLHTESPLIVPTQQQIHVFQPQDLFYLSAEGAYCYLHLEQERCLSARTLSHYERQLSPQYFQRVHDKYLVNLRKVSRYHRGKGGMVELSNGQKLEVSTRKKAAFLQTLDQLGHKLLD